MIAETSTETFRPCVVIPIFDHGQTIGGVLDGLEPLGLETIIVDDGSGEETRQVLTDLEASREHVRVVRLPENRGKGAAVAKGLETSHDAGFTHALQVDADGQHCVADAPRFLELGKESPGACILAAPAYDESAPRSRLIGRKITNFWVAVETLSMKTGDTMCGFRLYPLGPCKEILDKRRLPERMGFDIEIVVRLVWLGVPLVHLETPVVYPESGTSHFHMVRDNLAITGVHIRLVIGMLLRLPAWLVRGRPRRAARKTAGAAEWSSIAERGSIVGIRFLYFVYRVLGRRICTFFLTLVVAYFFVTGRRARRASREYFERLRQSVESDPAAVSDLPGGLDAIPRPSLWTSYRHFLEFGLASTDKIAAWRGDIGPEHLDWKNKKEFEEILKRDRGVFFISAHLGNAEIGRALAKANHDILINALMFTKHAEHFNRVLRGVSPDQSVRIVGLEEITPSLVTELEKRLDSGEFISVFADRIPVGSTERILHVPFLGGTAAFPQGPWILASLLQCPVCLLFFLRTGPGRYSVHFEMLFERIDLPRKERNERLHDVIQHYAKSVERYCRLAPRQWFNFYDFWSSDPPQGGEPARNQRRDSGRPQEGEGAEPAAHVS